MVLSHVAFQVSSFEESRKFYSAALAALGYTEQRHYESRAAGFGINNAPDFWIANGNGQPSKGVHVAFAVESRDVVHKFHEAALKAGGKDNGAPGLREHYAPGYYAAFVHDLDGNNIEVVTFAGEK
ncbi:Glyoxalase/Bleomycin resistance protein/Dihydroxybiphenyl dioxygenase [Cyathus striatus]|nr:Glyoxalase/Bleomycin resistance protein/Dihydroxybiphenyl dioxygenase [Cyathus striatus]